MNQYTEQKVSQRLTVNWNNAIIQYSVKVFRYAFSFGAAVSSIALLYHGLPYGRPEWVRFVLLVLSGGLLSAGFFALGLLIVKDLFFPYMQPFETIRAIDPAQASSAMQAAPLMVQEAPNIWRYGKHKLEPDRLLALAQAILQGGETRISQNKLAEWGVVIGKTSQEAKQLKADLVYLGYGIEAGNNELSVTPSLVAYLQEKFPAMAPPTLQTNVPK